MGQDLIREAEPRTDVLVVRFDACIFVNAVLPGYVDLLRDHIEVRPAIRDFTEGAVIIPADAQVESKLAGYSPVISKISSDLGTALSRPVERVIVKRGSRVSEQEACHRIAA